MKDRINKIKNHFEENKKYYIVGAGCGAVGFASAVGAFYATGGTIQIVDGFKIQICSPTTNTVQLIQNVTRQGPPSWIIENKNTGEKFMSQRRAALLNGHSMNRLSSHLNDPENYPDVDGQKYERVGLRINPEVN